MVGNWQYEGETRGNYDLPSYAYKTLPTSSALLYRDEGIGAHRFQYLGNPAWEQLSSRCRPVKSLAQKADSVKVVNQPHFNSVA
jgi:hypothetical protein